jgi:hypothetical protein
MIENTGNFRLRNGHGSGMIRFVWNSSPPNGGEFRSGNVTDTLVTGSTAVSGGASPSIKSAAIFYSAISISFAQSAFVPASVFAETGRISSTSCAFFSAATDFPS